MSITKQTATPMRLCVVAMQRTLCSCRPRRTLAPRERASASTSALERNEFALSPVPWPPLSIDPCSMFLEYIVQL